ncbi:ATP-dependent DNA helicase pfh1-like [Neltuma alba]|uniref:ATP-dependent DNA helicase pfh1-like n=1 Tax=Neltuma alba TaxID=207710 RepID=UPI0010A30F8C|nr:ATP-dependent DNA helicase pfh1-like [Prosopis alba]
MESLQVIPTYFLRLSSSSSTDNSKLKLFSDWLLDIGDGRIGLPHDGMAEIEVPDDFLIMDYHDPLQSIVEATYPDLLHHLADSEYLTNRDILTPTVEVVDQINDYMCSLLPGEPIVYFSSHSVSIADQGCASFQELYTIEFLNTIKCSGLPPHRLAVKVGVPIMLVRNIDQAAGLCNGTRLKNTFLGKHFIKAIALNGTSTSQEVLIHRMDMNSSESRLPFMMTRRQFPIILSFAMTINKSQGQSMTNVGLYLRRPVFTHGQLYVALSRVKSMDGIKILILDSDKNPTTRPLMWSTEKYFKTSCEAYW